MIVQRRVLATHLQLTTNHSPPALSRVIGRPHKVCVEGFLAAGSRAPAGGLDRNKNSVDVGEHIWPVDLENPPLHSANVNREKTEIERFCNVGLAVSRLRRRYARNVQDTNRNSRSSVFDGRRDPVFDARNVTSKRSGLLSDGLIDFLTQSD